MSYNEVIGVVELTKDSTTSDVERIRTRIESSWQMDTELNLGEGRILITRTEE